MRVTTRGVEKLAQEAGISDSTIERHIDELVSLTLLVAKRERKLCKRAIRAWYFDRSMNKPPLFDGLEDIDEDLI